MVDELTICAAAFFRNKGREVIAGKEFAMGISLDLRWMTVNEAASLARRMISSGVLESKDGYLRPTFDISEVDIPMAYRPSTKLIESLKTVNDTPVKGPVKMDSVSKGPAVVKNEKEDDNVFSEMFEMAKKSGMKRPEFIAKCNSLQKQLNIDIEVAGVMVLRDIGADVSSLYERVREAVLSK